MSSNETPDADPPTEDEGAKMKATKNPPSPHRIELAHLRPDMLTLRTGKFFCDGRTLEDFVYVPKDFDFSSKEGMDAILAALDIPEPELLFTFTTNNGVVPNTNYSETARYWNLHPNDSLYFDVWNGRNDLKYPNRKDYMAVHTMEKRVQSVLDAISEACSQTSALYLIAAPFTGNIFSEMACRSAQGKCVSLGVFTASDFSVIQSNKEGTAKPPFPEEPAGKYGETEAKFKTWVDWRDAKEAELIQDEADMKDNNLEQYKEEHKWTVPWHLREHPLRVKVPPDTFTDRDFVVTQGESPKCAIHITCSRADIEEDFYQAFRHHQIDGGLASKCSHRLVFPTEAKKEQFCHNLRNMFPTGQLVVGSGEEEMNGLEKAIRFGRPLFILENTGIASNAAAELVRLGALLRAETYLQTNGQIEDYLMYNLPNSVALWNQITVSDKIWYDVRVLARNFGSVAPHFNPNANKIFDISKPVALEKIQDDVTRVMGAVFDTVSELGGLEQDGKVLREANHLRDMFRDAKYRYRIQAAAFQVLIRGVILAAVYLTVFQSTMVTTTWLSDDLKLINTILPLIASILITLEAAFRPSFKYASLLLAEKRIESELYRYRTRTGPFKNFGKAITGKINKNRSVFSARCQTILADCIKSDVSHGSLVGISSMRTRKARGTHKAKTHAVKHEHDVADLSLVTPAVRFHDDVETGKEHEEPAEGSRMTESSMLLGSSFKQKPKKTAPRVQKPRGDDNMLYSRDYAFQPVAKDGTRYSPPQHPDIFYSRNYDFRPDQDFVNTDEMMWNKFEQMRKNLARSTEDDGGLDIDLRHAGIMKTEDYILKRLEKSKDEFLEELPKLIFWNRVFLVLTIGLTATATAFVSAGLEAWVPVVLAFGTAMEFANTYLQLSTRIPNLNASASELGQVKLWWEGLTLIQTRQPSNKDKLVDQTEHAILSQYEQYAGATLVLAKKRYAAASSDHDHVVENADSDSAGGKGTNKKKANLSHTQPHKSSPYGTV